MAPIKYHMGEFPPRELDWKALIGPTAEASQAVTGYDRFLGIIPDSDILISPMMMQEAVSSSRIEGTKATVSDVLVFEAGGDSDPLMHNDVKEVLNYQRAVHHAELMLKTLPLSGRVLRESHKILLEGVRGQYKSPGMYRTEQNWIGTSLDVSKARYLPPSPDAVPELMAKWEGFVNGDDLPPLLRIAIAHAEFESIHPFLDGNGRIGRMMIPLMLCSSGMLSHPSFYLSEFFEQNNGEYRDRLLAVSRDGDWTGWCLYFLEAIKTQAQENDAKARDIHSLYENTRAALLAKSGSAHADAAVRCLFYGAIFPGNVFTRMGGLTEATARRLLKLMKDEGIVMEMNPSRGSRPAILVFPELLKITEGLVI